MSGVESKSSADNSCFRGYTDAEQVCKNINLFLPSITDSNPKASGLLRIHR